MKNGKRNIWLAILAVVVLGFAGYRVFFGAASARELPDRFVGYGVCLACNEEAVVDYKRGESEPFMCEACGERAVYLWWFCNDCGYRFIPQLVADPKGGPPKPTPFPICPHCGCRGSLTGWDADNPAQAPEGDAELPEWP